MKRALRLAAKAAAGITAGYTATVACTIDPRFAAAIVLLAFVAGAIWDGIRPGGLLDTDAQLGQALHELALAEDRPRLRVIR